MHLAVAKLNLAQPVMSRCCPLNIITYHGVLLTMTGLAITKLKVYASTITYLFKISGYV